MSACAIDVLAMNQPNARVAVLLNDLLRPVGRAIVDNYHLEDPTGLREDRVQCPLDVPGFVVQRDDDGYCGFSSLDRRHVCLLYSHFLEHCSQQRNRVWRLQDASSGHMLVARHIAIDWSVMSEPPRQLISLAGGVAQQDGGSLMQLQEPRDLRPPGDVAQEPTQRCYQQ